MWTNKNPPLKAMCLSNANIQQTVLSTNGWQFSSTHIYKETETKSLYNNQF